MKVPRCSLVAARFSAAFLFSAAFTAPPLRAAPAGARPLLPNAAGASGASSSAPLRAPLGNLPAVASADGQPLSAVVSQWPGMAQATSIRPPDPHGSAGPNGVLQVVNTRVAYWDKTGGSLWGPTSLATFFPWVSPGTQSDPRALYDPATQRFYVAVLELPFLTDPANLRSFIDVAVSKSSDPASATTNDWYVYQIDNTLTVNTNSFFGDYTTLGYDGQAIYVTLNTYSILDFVMGSGATPGDEQITVLNKAAFLNGTTNYSFVYVPGGPSAAFTLQPCTVIGTNSPGNVAYFGETFPGNNSRTQVRVWALTDPLGAQTLTSRFVSIPNNGGPPTAGAPQRGTTITVDPLDGRTQGNAFWNNGSVWFCTTAGASAGRTSVYYYEVNLNGFPAGTPALGTAGSISGGSAWTYQPSIGGNDRGDVCVVFTQSSGSSYPSIRYAIRPSGATNFDPAVTLKVSPAYSNSDRWGDYGSVSVDPLNDSFWVTHEWSRSTRQHDWGTWWANLLAGNPPALTQQPAGQTVFQGDSVTFTATAAGTAPLVYQWQFNGAPLGGTTNTSLVLSNVALSLSGVYAVLVTNIYGSVTSTGATLIVMPTVPLALALNTTNLVWLTDGDALWRGLNGVSHDGVSAAQSGALQDGQTTRLKTTLTGPGTLTFWWKVSSEANGDILSLNLDGTPLARISGEVDWRLMTAYIPAGVHTLTWAYTKNASGSSGQDRAWVDQVAFTPGATAPFIASQPASQNLLAGSPATFRVSAGGTPPLAYQWFFNGDSLPGATSPALTLARTWTTNSGAYWLVVTNAAGSITSSPAFLAVVPLTAWGNNNFAQSSVQPQLTNAVAIAAGGYHSLALRADGSVFAWGDDFDGQSDVPAGVSDAVGLAGGDYHSLAVSGDGTVAAWGADYYGQTTVPEDATNVVAVAAGSWHSLALRADGTVVAWGDDSWSQIDVPANLAHVVAVAAGSHHSLALEGDGTVVAWGDNSDAAGNYVGQAVPPPGLRRVVAVSAGGFHSVALKSDGTVVVWGDNSQGQAAVPPGLANVVAIAAGGTHTLALLRNGRVVAWGSDLSGESTVATNLANVTAIAAGAYHSLALLGQSVPGARLMNPVLSGNAFTISVPTVRGKFYTLQYQTSLADTEWFSVAVAPGDGTVRTLTDPTASAGQRFYRVRQQ